MAKPQGAGVHRDVAVHAVGALRAAPIAFASAGSATAHRATASACVAALSSRTISKLAALCTAINDAESAGLPQEYLEDAIRTQAELAICKAELWQLYIASDA